MGIESLLRNYNGNIACYSYSIWGYQPLPSGYVKQFAIENGPVEIVDLPSCKMGGSFHSYVSLPEGILDA